MAFYQSLAYEASAGSGKTFALVIRYISLLYLGAKPSTILTLTFTNKAANEMRVRISAVLAQLHLPQREAERSAIAQTLEISEEEVLSKRQEIYENYLSSDLKISTIDKFFAQVLRLFAQHLGLMPDFTIDELTDEQRFILKFISNIKRKNAYKDLVLFSARESKKLKDIFTFLSTLYTKDAELSQLSSPQSNSISKINEKDILVLVEELHTLFADHCTNLSATAQKTLDNINNIDELMKRGWLKKESFNYWLYKKCYIPAMDELLHKIKIKLALYFIHKEHFLLSKYLELYQIYKETILEENIATNTLAFNDVTNLLFRLLHEKIDRNFLYFRLDATIDHLLIDEFQDTNIVQYKILEPIIEEIHAGVGSRELKSFFYVGDIKQSIYRFRGGAKELFHYVGNRFNVKIDKLNINYRSDCNIVTFVNETFQHKIKNYTPQQCRKKSNKGYVKVRTYDDLSKGVREEVFRLLAHGIHADDIAILTYTNADAYTIEEALLEKDKKLKITTQTSIKLINNRYVSAVVEFLKYLYFDAQLAKANFLTLIGKSWESSIDLSTFKKTGDLPSLVKQIILTYKLPGNNRNLLKLIEVVAEYKDIEAFLFACEDLNIDSPSKKSEGIRILTIHKSKGLEFKHVILADRFKNKSADRATLIFSYDTIKLEKIYLRISGRDNVDKSYHEALQREKRLTLEDELNALYVAFTRAENSLIVVQNSEKSAFNILSLTPVTIGNLPDNKRTQKAKSTLHKDITTHYHPVKLGLQEQKIKKEKEHKEDIYAINFGTALHYMLEILDSFSTEDIENAWWAMKNRYEAILREGDTQKIKMRVERLLSYEPFMKLVEGVITKEQPIVYNNELKQLDLLIRKKDRYIIIDYKSSAQIRSEHKQQVHHYKTAVAEITQSTVDAYLCYIRDEEIELLPII